MTSVNLLRICTVQYTIEINVTWTLVHLKQNVCIYFFGTGLYFSWKDNKSRVQLWMCLCLTCWAVSIRWFSSSSIWKPCRSTSSVDSGRVAVNVERRERDVRLQMSSMGSWGNIQSSINISFPLKTPNTNDWERGTPVAMDQMIPKLSLWESEKNANVWMPLNDD